MTPIGSEHSLQSAALGPTYRREAIAASRSASARISTERAIWSNGSSIRSNSVGGSRRAMTSSPRTIWPSSNSHQYGCGCAPMSPRPIALGSAGEEDLNETVKPLKEVPPVQVRPGQSRSGRTSSECCLFVGRLTGGSVHSKEAGREDSAPTSDIIATPTPLG